MVEISAQCKQYIEYVQIMSTGNAVDFGDLTELVEEHQLEVSNGHGGL